MNNQYTRMTSMFLNVAIVTLALGAVVSQSRGETPSAAIDAIGRLRSAANYSWTTTTETTGAPFTIAPIEGKTDTTGFAVLKLRAGGKSLQAVTKGNRGVVKVGAAWKTSAEISGGKKEIKKISTVAIVDIGSTKVEVPADAKAKLETVQ